jgi:hypothetical protein
MNCSGSERSITRRFNPRGSRLEDSSDLTTSQVFSNSLSQSSLDKENKNRNFKSEISERSISKYRIFDAIADSPGETQETDQDQYSDFHVFSSENFSNGQFEGLLNSVIPSERTIFVSQDLKSAVKSPNYSLIPKKSILVSKPQTTQRNEKIRNSVVINECVEVHEVENWKIFNIDVARGNEDLFKGGSSLCSIF